MLRIAACVWLAWLALMMWQDAWYLFQDNWFMTVTMAFGSFIAGATSEGGGAVAFPVMTLLFDIQPSVARDFALMIQAIGMLAAAATIVFARIPIETRALMLASLGGAVGVVIGLEVVSPRLPAPYVKTFFTSVWLSFAAALYWVNRRRDRRVFATAGAATPGHDALLIGTGIVGGIISGTTGSGLDILTFSLLVLAFGVDERVATPTSVMLMGGNALVGFMWKLSFSSQPLAHDAWSYWYVCIPVVVIGAPLGVHFISHRSRLFVAGFLYLSISVQFLAALLIVPQSAALLLFSGATVLSGIVLFRVMAHAGARRVAGEVPGEDEQ